MKKVLLALAIITSTLSAEVIEAKQLFNKKIVEVKKEKFDRSKAYYAKISLDESNIKEVTTRYDGFVEKLYANKNYQEISKGEKLATLYSEEILNIQKELALAKKMGDNRLLKSSGKKLELLDIKKSEIKRLENSDNELVNIYAKSGGYILDKNIYEGSFVKSGKSLFKIADFSSMWVIAKVYQKDISFLKDGMDAVVKVDGISQNYKAKLDFIYPKIDDKDNSVDVRLIVKNEDSLLFPNMFAKVKFIASRDEILTLPRSAVLTKGNKHYVFIPLDNNMYEPKEIDAKRLHNGKFEVLSKLDEGDKVIDKVLFMLDSDAVTNGLYDSDEDEDW